MEQEQRLDCDELAIIGGRHDLGLVVLSHSSQSPTNQLPPMTMSVFLPNQSVFSLLVTHDTLKLYVDGFLRRSKSLTEYFAIMKQILTEGTIALGNETVKLFINHLEVSNQVQIQWKVISSISRTYLLGELNLPQLTDQNQIKMLSHQLLWLSIPNQQNLQSQLDQCQTELKKSIHDRNAAVDELSKFAWSARERDDSNLLKCLAIINEKKRKVKKLQEKLMYISLNGHGTDDGQEPALVHVPATTLIPKTEKNVVDLKPRQNRKRGRVQMAASDDSDDNSRKPLATPPPGFPRSFKAAAQQLPSNLAFPILPLQLDKLPPSTLTTNSLDQADNLSEDNSDSEGDKKIYVKEEPAEDGSDTE